MRKFKRALSSVLVFVMVLSLVTVMNISNVFASITIDAINTYSETHSFTFGGETITTLDNKQTYYALNNGLYYYSGGNSNTGTISEDSKESGYTKAYVGANGDSGKCALVFKAGAAGKLYVKAKASKSGCNVGIYTKGGESTITESAIPISTDLTTTSKYNIAKDSVVYITSRSGGSVSIYEIVYEVSSDPEISFADEEVKVAAGSTYQLTLNTANLDDAEISYAAEGASTISVDPTSGLVTVDESAKAGETSTITATASLSGSEYKATCKITVFEYSKMTEAKKWDFSTNSIKAGDLENGLYAMADMILSGSGSDKYVAGSVNGAKNGNEVTGSAMRFNVAVDGKVKVEFRLGNPDPKDGYFSKVGETALEDIWHESAMYDRGTKEFDVKAGNVYFFYGTGTKVGFYSITFIPTVIQNADTTSNKAGVYYAGEGKYYAVSVIDGGTDLSKYESLSQKINDNELEKNGTTVIYEGIKVDAQDYKAESFGGKAGDYVYATQITDANDFAAIDKLKAIKTVLNTASA